MAASAASFIVSAAPLDRVRRRRAHRRRVRRGRRRHTHHRPVLRLYGLRPRGPRPLVLFAVVLSFHGSSSLGPSRPRTGRCWRQRGGDGRACVPSRDGRGRGGHCPARVCLARTPLQGPRAWTRAWTPGRKHAAGASMLQAQACCGRTVCGQADVAHGTQPLGSVWDPVQRILDVCYY